MGMFLLCRLWAKFGLERVDRMTNEELKAALFSGCPIVADSPLYGKIKYKCVSAIIYRNKGGKLDVSAELLDKNNNSVSIVNPKYIEEDKK